MLKEVLKTYNLSRESKNGLNISKVSITVRKGDIYALLGRSDSGTSTIIRMLAGLVRPTSGSIELFGNEVSFGNTGICTGSGRSWQHWDYTRTLRLKRTWISTGG